MSRIKADVRHAVAKLGGAQAAPGYHQGGFGESLRRTVLREADELHDACVDSLPWASLRSQPVDRPHTAVLERPKKRYNTSAQKYAATGTGNGVGCHSVSASGATLI